MIDTESLVVFTTIVEKGSFSGAAEVLRQTPSGISRALSRLEKQLNVRLLTRTTRRLNLTDEGRWFLERSQSILKDLNDTEAELSNSVSSPRGTIRVNSSTPVFESLIAPLMPDFMATYPHIHFEFVCNEGVIDLIEQKADIAIRVGELSDSTLNARRLAESRMYLVASPEYLEKSGCPLQPQDLSGHQLLGFTAPSSLNVWPLAVNGSEGMAIDPVIQCSNGAVLRKLVLEGAGIACLSDFFIKDDIDNGKLSRILTEYHLGWHKDIWAVFYKKGQLPARMQLFVDYLSQQIFVHC